jgi:hypothetical protein
LSQLGLSHGQAGGQLVKLALTLAKLLVALLKLALALVKFGLSPLSAAAVLFGLGGSRAGLLLGPCQLLDGSVELRGDTAFQLAELVALRGNSLAGAAALVVDRLGERCLPTVGGGSVAERFFHGNNRHEDLKGRRSGATAQPLRPHGCYTSPEPERQSALPVMQFRRAIIERR